jgi:chromate transporter
VVGVIVSLALFFGEHVFWPQGPGGRLDFSAALIATAAAVALIRFKRPVVQVIAACALAGWGLSVLA